MCGRRLPLQGHLASRQRVPVFWALTKATLLVSGSSRMKPHSLCMGFRVSGWKALNLHGNRGEGGAHTHECRDAGPPLSTEERASRGNRRRSDGTADTWVTVCTGRGHQGLLPAPGHTSWNPPATSHSPGLICTCRTAAGPLQLRAPPKTLPAPTPNTLQALALADKTPPDTRPVLL